MPTCVVRISQTKHSIVSIYRVMPKRKRAAAHDTAEDDWDVPPEDFWDACVHFVEASCELVLFARAWRECSHHIIAPPISCYCFLNMTILGHPT